MDKLLQEAGHLLWMTGAQTVASLGQKMEADSVVPLGLKMVHVVLYQLLWHHHVVYCAQKQQGGVEGRKKRVFQKNQVPGCPFHLKVGA
jgi:hypothetical protein